MTPWYADDAVTVWHGDCLDILADMADNSVDAVCTDPPYGLEFMGREWDRFGGDVRQPFRGEVQTPDNPYGRSTVRYAGTSGYGGQHNQAMLAYQQWCQTWAEHCLRVLKPGGHLLAFGGTRTHHRLACAIEDAGFEIRDSIAWIYASGFPKSRNVSQDLNTVRCQCEPLPYSHGGDVRGMRRGVHQATQPSRTGEVADLLSSMQRPSSRASVGDLREDGPSGLDRNIGAVLPAEDERAAEPGMEGWSDLRPGQGQLRGRPVRTVSANILGNGPVGRVRDGAPVGHSTVDRPAALADGGGQSQGPQSAEQRPEQSGAVADKRRPQTWRGWPICERCSQPVIPDGLGTAAKPAHEPIVVARKPLAGTVAGNVLTWGTGALNIDAARVPMSQQDAETIRNAGGFMRKGWTRPDGTLGEIYEGTVDGSLASVDAIPHDAGRWPPNVALDQTTATQLDQENGTSVSRASAGRNGADQAAATWGLNRSTDDVRGHDDSGGASRFFPVFRHNESEDPCTETQTTDDSTNSASSAANAPKSTTPSTPAVGDSTTMPPTTRIVDRPLPVFRYEPKAPTLERPRPDGQGHPTTKPLDLMRWLVRLVCPPGGVVLDPFLGSGTTAEACIVEGFRCIGVEREDTYLPMIRARLTKPIQPVLDLGEL